MKTANEERRLCTNEGCGREAEPSEALCEGCGLEWGLLRRDLRPLVGAGLVPARDSELVTMPEGGRPQGPPLQHAT